MADGITTFPATQDIPPRTTSMSAVTSTGTTLMIIQTPRPPAMDSLTMLAATASTSTNQMVILPTYVTTSGGLTRTATAKIFSNSTPVSPVASPDSTESSTRSSSGLAASTIAAAIVGAMLGVMMFVPFAGFLVIHHIRWKYLSQTWQAGPTNKTMPELILDLSTQNGKNISPASSTIAIPRKEDPTTPPKEKAEIEGSSPVPPLSDDASPIAQATEPDGCYAILKSSIQQRPQSGYFARRRPPPESSKPYRAAIRQVGMTEHLVQHALLTASNLASINQPALHAIGNLSTRTSSDMASQRTGMWRS